LPACCLKKTTATVAFLVRESIISQGFVGEYHYQDSCFRYEAHSGDKHGSPDEHRASFPGGRVGSHSALAKPEHGVSLLEAASVAVMKDCQRFGR